MSAAVSHDLVTVKETGSQNGIRSVDSENKSIFLPNHGLLTLIVFALNHVQPTSHAPPATASVNQGVVISSDHMDANLSSSPAYVEIHGASDAVTGT